VTRARICTILKHWISSRSINRSTVALSSLRSPHFQAIHVTSEGRRSLSFLSIATTCILTLSQYRQRNAKVKRCLPSQQLHQAHHQLQTRVQSQTTTSNPQPTSLPRRTSQILQQVPLITHLPHQQDTHQPHLSLGAQTITPQYHTHKGDMARYEAAR